MQCFRPVDGFRRADGGFTLAARTSAEAAPMVVRCGRCLGCRVNRREEWKVRCLHEASLYSSNSFVTFTYDDGHVPPFGSVRMDDVSSAIKRLRWSVRPARFRFLAKTEYGPKTFRPHAHLLLFGLGFPDRVVVRRTASDELSYSSELLSSAWGLGFAECSDLTPRSVGYVCNHNVDKLVDIVDDEFYRRVDHETGEVVEIERESLRVSNRPGIGKAWVDRWEVDCFPSGFIVESGHRMNVPRYYRKRLKGRFLLRGAYRHTSVPFDDSRVVAAVAEERLNDDPALRARQEANSTPERLAVREEVLHLKVKRLKRDAI